MQSTNTREQWLNDAAGRIMAVHLNPLLGLDERPTHGYSISIAPPHSNRLGECWKKEASEDNTCAIFISAKLNDSIRILDVLLHELIHYADNLESGHRGFFRRVATQAGLVGKMTQTTASTDLQLDLMSIVDELGEIPHAQLTASRSGQKKQKSRNHKIQCDHAPCGFAFNTNKTQIAKITLPNAQCPACSVWALNLATTTTKEA